MVLWHWYLVLKVTWLMDISKADIEQRQRNTNRSLFVITKSTFESVIIKHSLEISGRVMKHNKGKIIMKKHYDMDRYGQIYIVLSVGVCLLASNQIIYVMTLILICFFFCVRMQTFLLFTQAKMTRIET